MHEFELTRSLSYAQECWLYCITDGNYDIVPLVTHDDTTLYKLTLYDELEARLYTLVCVKLADCIYRQL